VVEVDLCCAKSAQWVIIGLISLYPYFIIPKVNNYTDLCSLKE